VPLRVVFLIQNLHYGGAERQLVGLARGFQEAGCEVTVATFRSGGELQSTLIAAGIKPISLGKSGRFDLLRPTLRLIGLIRSREADILYSFLPAANVLGAIAKPFLRSCRLVWGIRSAFVDLGRYDRMTRLSYTVQAWLSYMPDCIVANSVEARSTAIAAGISNKNFHIIPNGIDTERFSPDERQRAETRRAWGILPEAPLVGIVGRLDTMKDHPTFLRAAAEISQARNDVRFVCVGGGPADYHAELRQLAADLGLNDRISWVGPMDAVELAYNAIDVLVCSSHGESFPNVVAEAMACGVPCVSTDVGASRCIVGAAGRVVPSKDPIALAEAGLAILALPPEQRRQMKVETRQRILQNFALPRLVDRTIELFEVAA